MESYRGKKPASTRGSRGSSDTEQEDQRVFRMTYDTHDIRSAVISPGSQGVMSSLKERLAERDYAGKTTSRTPSRVHAFLQNQFGGDDDSGDRSASPPARPPQPQYESGWEKQTSIPRNSSIPSKVFQALQQTVGSGNTSPEVSQSPPQSYKGPPIRQLSNDALDKARSQLWEEQVLGMKSESRVPSRSFKLLQHLYDPDDEDTHSSASGGSAGELQSALDLFEKELEALNQPDIQKTVVERPNFSPYRRQQSFTETQQAPPVPVRNESFQRTRSFQSPEPNLKKLYSKTDYRKDNNGEEEEVEEAVMVAVAPVSQMMTYTAQIETPWILGQGNQRVPNKRIGPNQENEHARIPVNSSRQIPPQQVHSHAAPRLPDPGAGYRPPEPHQMRPRQFQPDKGSRLSDVNSRQQEQEPAYCKQLEQQAFYVSEQPQQGSRSSSRPQGNYHDHHDHHDNQQSQVSYASYRKGSEGAGNDAESQKFKTSNLREGISNDNSAFSKVPSAKKSNMNIVTTSVGKEKQNNDNSSSERSIADDIDDVIKELSNFERALNDRVPGERIKNPAQQILAKNIRQTVQQEQADRIKETAQQISQVCQSESIPSSYARPEIDSDDSSEEHRSAQPSKQFNPVPASSLLENSKPRPWIPAPPTPQNTMEDNSMQRRQSPDSDAKEHHDVSVNTPKKHQGHSMKVAPAVQVQRSSQRQLTISDKNAATEAARSKRDALTSPVTVHVQRRHSQPLESITDSREDLNAKLKDVAAIRNGVSQVDHNHNEAPKVTSKIVISSIKKRGSSEEVFDDGVDPEPSRRPTSRMSSSSTSSNGSVTSIKISSRTPKGDKRQESVSSESQQSVSSSDEYDELFTGDAVPYRISSRRKSAVKSTTKGVKIDIPLANHTGVSSGTANDPPEIQLGSAFQVVHVGDAGRR